MSGVAGPRNCPEEEGKGKGHKFLWLFCDLVRGAFCRPCDTRQIQLLGQRTAIPCLKAAAFTVAATRSLAFNVGATRLSWE